MKFTHLNPDRNPIKFWGDSENMFILETSQRVYKELPNNCFNCYNGMQGFFGRNSWKKDTTRSLTWPLKNACLEDDLFQFKKRQLFRGELLNLSDSAAEDSQKKRDRLQDISIYDMFV